jgi:hypothetical protein
MEAGISHDRASTRGVLCAIRWRKRRFPVDARGNAALFYRLSPGLDAVLCPLRRSNSIYLYSSDPLGSSGSWRPQVLGVEQLVTALQQFVYLMPIERSGVHFKGHPTVLPDVGSLIETKVRKKNALHILSNF